MWAILRNPAYKGKACFGKTLQMPRERVTRPVRLRKVVPSATSGGHERPREEWIEIPVPAIVSEETFALEHAEVVGLLLGDAAHDVGVVLEDEGELEVVEMGMEGIEVGSGLMGCHREVLRAGGSVLCASSLRRVRGRAGGARVRAGRRAG